MPHSAKITIAAVLLFLLGLWGIHGAQRLAAAEAKIEAAAAEALNAAGDDWVQARADGQKIILSGDAPDRLALDTVTEKISSAIGPGGLLFGAVTRVDASAVTIAPTIKIENYRWQAERQGTVLKLTGYAPSIEARRIVQERAKHLFPDFAVDDATIVAARPDEGVWLVAAATSMSALAVLSNGVLVNEAMSFSLAGEAATALNAEIARQTMARTPHPLTVSAVEIDAPPPVEPAPGGQEQTPTDPPEPQKPPAPTPQELAASCQNALTQLLLGDPVQFASAQYAMENRSRKALNTAADILSKCDAVEILVGGHTDASGSDTHNQSLSLLRAETVADYLAAQGIEARRITARGFGDTKPIATNQTSGGRARNRRIEITVEPAKNR